MRIFTALAITVVNVGLGCCLTAAPASADVSDPLPLSQCYTVTITPPTTDLKPSVTVCQP